MAPKSILNLTLHSLAFKIPDIHYCVPMPHGTFPIIPNRLGNIFRYLLDPFAFILKEVHIGIQQNSCSYIMIIFAAVVMEGRRYNNFPVIAD